MALTSRSTSDALTRKVWAEKLFRDAQYDAYVQRLMGTSSEHCVHVKRDLEGEKGDKITFGLVKILSGDGVTSGSQLEGNEESLISYDSSVTLEQYRHAVRDDGQMTRQRTIIDIPEEARTNLKGWMATKINRLAFAALGILKDGSTNPTKIFYRNSSGVFSSAVHATAKAGLDATNSKLNTDFIVAMKTWAMTGGNRTTVPLRPIKVDGEEVFVLLVHPDALYDLQIDSNFEAAHRDAMERGKSNPLFKGAVAYWRGVVVHAHELVHTAADGGGASVAWSKGALLGAQALCWAWGQTPKLVEKKFDYDDQMGFSIGMLAGVTAPTFNSQPYGSLGVYVSRTNISGV